jgi:hypothetical protein
MDTTHLIWAGIFNLLSIRNLFMNKLLAILVAGLFATGAFATTPAASAAKPAAKAEMKAEAKPAASAASSAKKAAKAKNTKAEKKVEAAK